MAWVTEAIAEAIPAHLATSGFGTPTYSMSSGYQYCEYIFDVPEEVDVGSARRPSQARCWWRRLTRYGRIEVKTTDEKEVCLADV